MRKISQQVVGPGKGDCLAACIASILECELDQLPNPHSDNWWGEWHTFLKSHGLMLLGKGRSAYFWDTYWIGVLPSLNFEKSTHAVVMQDDRLVHDPNVPPSKLYEEATYKDCLDGYVIILSDAGLFRRSNLWDRQLMVH